MRNAGYVHSEDPESPRGGTPSPHGSPSNGHLDHVRDCSHHPPFDYSRRNIGEWEESQVKGDTVIVRNATKSFKSSQPVLNDLSMTVHSGTIYSLLGSSGCGKTTLLSCCVGLQRLDAGEIRVLGAPPGTKGSGVPGPNVGYMPQELSLYMEFTISESFSYFGQVYGLSRSKITSSMDFLLDLLELPDASRQISTLSGGQKRRVSFALAIFHSPSLLILDEPTVGVDPLLRESIWKYLCELVSTEKCTVIITTHYIEEARQSNKVGVMRNGRLLVEKSPEELMEEHGVPLLEQVVLKLCRKDQSGRQVQSASDHTHPPALTLPSHKDSPGQLVTGIKFSPLKDPSYTQHLFQGKYKNSPSQPCAQSFTEDIRNSLCRLRALLFKNFIVLIRNIWFLLFIFLVPSVQVMLICLAIGPDPKNLRFGVINNELPFFNLSHGICEPTEDCQIPYLFSCRYLQMLPKESINVVSYKREEEALDAIERGYLWGYLSFPENYSSSIMERALSGAYSSEETYDSSRITFQMDMSNKQVGTTVQKIFFDVFQKFMVETSVDCGANPRQTEIPLYFKRPVYGSNDTSFSEFMAPSVLMGLLFFFPLCSSGISYITEKKSGTLHRSLVSGVTSFEIMVAYLVSQTFVLLGQSGLAFCILTLVFKIQIMGSIWWAISLSVFIGIGGMSMGFLIATICKEEIEAVLLAIGSFLPNLLLAGMVWPIEGMPLALQYIGYFLPCTLACESMRSIVTRGWGIGHPSVWLGFASTLVWIIIYWILTILIHRLSSRK